ncbi:MAG: N-methyl-L-tryptophan oxidase [Burkholderiales bacterium]|nr:N-methyl-L-tryptophan oxidase [Burkholderiales bacterium]
MKTEYPDVLVIGLGAMGSATVYQLAKLGVKVVGIDQYTPPHTHGSTHGETRITREAIGEGARFVPLAIRSHQLWREIESQTGQVLLTACGGLILARAGQGSALHGQSDFLGATIRAAEAFGISHQRLDATEIAARFPQFVLRGDECGYFEPGAGYLKPEECVRAQLSLARQHGADLRFGEAVRSVTHLHGKTIVESDRIRYAPGKTIIAAGPWAPQLLPDLKGTLTVRRQVLYWFKRDAVSAHSYLTKDFPIFIWHWGSGADDVFYGFPQMDDSGAIKVATEQQQFSTTPETVQRDVSVAEIAAMHARHIAGKLRGISAHNTKAQTCLYTDTPGANFIIDTLPNMADAIVISACSGHGFKHAAAVGEAVAQMATSGTKPEVLLPFAFNPPPVLAG